MCWRAKADLGDYAIPEETMAPVLVPGEWESRVGWSTNALPLEGGKYLVGCTGSLVETKHTGTGLPL